MKNNDNYISRELEDPAFLPYYAEASLIEAIGHLLHEAKGKRDDISYDQMGKLMDVSRQRAHQVVNDDDQNLTLSVVGRAAGALGLRWRVALENIRTGALASEYQNIAALSEVWPGGACRMMTGWSYLPGGLRKDENHAEWKSVSIRSEIHREPKVCGR